MNEVGRCTRILYSLGDILCPVYPLSKYRSGFIFYSCTMSKILFFALLGLAIYWWLRDGRPSATHSKKTSSDVHKPQQMVACAQCGVHVPESESLISDNQHYCCEQHRELGSVSASPPATRKH